MVEKRVGVVDGNKELFAAAEVAAEVVKALEAAETEALGEEDGKTVLGRKEKAGAGAGVGVGVGVGVGSG